MTAAAEKPLVLLTGATGYVGGRLLRALLSRGENVRCFSRDISKLPVESQAAAVQGQLEDEPALARALEGVSTAYYLIHAMTGEGDFAERDRRYADRFAAAASQAGVQRIIYLGGLGRGEELSDHLASRQEVGEVLRSSGVPVVELRASVVIGAGSTSFELARTLVEKLPCMVTPRWVRTLAQPIAIDDVVAYLLAAKEAELPQGGTFEIGGAEAVSYGDLMREYGRQRRLTRVMIPVPVLSPKISSLWLTLVAPRHAKVGKLLIEGVRNETTVHDAAAREVFPVEPVGLQEAVARAVAELPPPAPALSGGRSLGVLVLCVLASFAAGAIGNLVSLDAIRQWYPTIAKPAWTPPPWIFGPVWSLLYLMMGIAAWRVWRADGLREARLPLGLFAIQLVLNAAWSGIFFGLRQPGWALVEIIVLWIAIAATTLLFSARDKIAALLMLPYIAWVTFATALNAAIWWMNRG